MCLMKQQQHQGREHGSERRAFTTWIIVKFQQSNGHGTFSHNFLFVGTMVVVSICVLFPHLVKSKSSFLRQGIMGNGIFHFSHPCLLGPWPNTSLSLSPNNVTKPTLLLVFLLNVSFSGTESLLTGSGDYFFPLLGDVPV